MKKRLISLLCFISLLPSFFSGCSKDSKSHEIIQSETVQETVGSYYLYKTFDVQKYLSFLENFDETKYEIVDISTSMQSESYYESGEFYMITYKVVDDK